MGALLNMKTGWPLSGEALSRSLLINHRNTGSLSGTISYTLYICLFPGVWRIQPLFRSEREQWIYQDSSHCKYWLADRECVDRLVRFQTLFCRS